MGQGLRGYRELEVWQRAMDLVVEVAKLSRELPLDERFGLSSQLRRACVSIPANIAEGYGRSHRGDYLRHLSIARGSLMETETHILVAIRVGYLDEARCAAAWELSQRVGQMLNRLNASLQVNAGSTDGP